MVNLQAFPPTKKLHTQLIKYPQEIIPFIDQVLKDLIIAVAEEDQENRVVGMQGDEREDERERERVFFIVPWLQVRVTGPRHHLASSLRLRAQGI